MSDGLDSIRASEDGRSITAVVLSLAARRAAEEGNPGIRDLASG